MKRIRLYGLILGLALLSLVGLGLGRAHALEVPSAPDASYVLDNAEILTEQQELLLNQQIKKIKDESSNQVGILTVKDGEGVDAAQFATEVGRDWNVGGKETKNGVVIFISLQNPKRIQIAVSTGLEGALTDAVSGGISRNDIAPQFKQAKYYEGLSAGISAIDQATKGEYKAKNSNTTTEDIKGGTFFIVFVLVVLQAMFAVMSSSKSWWLGGVFGGVGSGLLGLAAGSWVAAITLGSIFVPLGLLFDYLFSKNYDKHKAKRKEDSNHNFPWYFGGGGGFSSGSGGGSSFGGFGGGGGSFGGGGGGSSW